MFDPFNEDHWLGRFLTSLCFCVMAYVAGWLCVSVAFLEIYNPFDDPLGRFLMAVCLCVALATATFFSEDEI